MRLKARLKAELPTPALVVDLDAFESNITKMQATVARAGKQLRPHAKAHKCIMISRHQVDAGAAGVCVATLAELDVMAVAGFNILLTTPVASSMKTDRVAQWIRGGANIRVVVDHPTQVQLYRDSAARAGVKLPVLIDLDILSSTLGS